VRILLPDPGSGSWLGRREEALRHTDPGFQSGILAEQVRTNARYVTEAARARDEVALRYYNQPNLFRIIITDTTAHVTLYDDDQHGRNSPCVTAKNPGLLYDFAVRVFTAAWETAASHPGISPEAGS
jgi:hypothetical protein